MIVPQVREILEQYLEQKGVSNKALIYRAEVKEALRCGNDAVNEYLKGLEPVRGGKPVYYSTNDVATRVVEMEAEK